MSVLELFPIALSPAGELSQPGGGSAHFVAGMGLWQFFSVAVMRHHH